jgi:uncharacterized membrane protein YfcA
MTDFSLVTALYIFLAYGSIDWLMTLYTLGVVSGKRLRSANAGTLIYALTSFGVITYVQDYRYIIPMLLGGWLGTYLSVWYEHRKRK